VKYKVLGAGPAGLSAAICLAKNGCKVDVFEETSVVGGHTGNNIQAIRNYGVDKGVIGKIEQTGIKLSHLNPIYRIMKYSPSHRCDEIYSKEEPIFYTFKRGVDSESLENQLAEQAQEKGANIILGKKAKVVDCHVIATGSRFDPVGIGYGAVFENSNFDEKTISFFFGNEFIQHGYAYVTPFGKDQITIAITSFNKSDFDTIGKKFKKFINEDKVVKEILRDAKQINRFSGYGHFNVPDTAIHKYKYFVGGAAGFVDPARGFGIKYALLSGSMAAKTMIDKQVSYDELWKNEFRQELVEGFNRRMLLNKLKLADYERFVKGEKISIEEYEKIPAGIKEAILNINGAIKLRSWKKRFEFEKML